MALALFTLIAILCSVVFFAWIFVEGGREKNRYQEEDRLWVRARQKPFCRFLLDPRLPNAQCVIPPLSQSGKLSEDPELAAAQARWLISKEQEAAMQEWEREFRMEPSVEEQIRYFAEKTPEVRMEDLMRVFSVEEPIYIDKRGELSDLKRQLADLNEEKRVLAENSLMRRN